jgi:hypothetical protein
VDQVFVQLRRIVVGVSVERLPVKHAGADDDDLWFIRVGNDAAAEVQIETGVDGSPPFLIEGMADDQRLVTSDTAEAATTMSMPCSAAGRQIRM